MNTGLETLNLLKDFVLKDNKNGLDRRFIIGSCDILEQELKELEEYRDADIKVCAGSLLICTKDFETLWNEHKALEILKKIPDNYKEGLIYTFQHLLVSRKITQEEFDLLMKELVWKV